MKHSWILILASCAHTARPIVPPNPSRIEIAVPVENFEVPSHPKDQVVLCEYEDDGIPAIDYDGYKPIFAEGQVAIGPIMKDGNFFASGFFTIWKMRKLALNP